MEYYVGPAIVRLLRRPRDCRGKYRTVLRLFRGFVVEGDLLASVETLMDLVGAMVSLRKALC